MFGHTHIVSVSWWLSLMTWLLDRWIHRSKPPTMVQPFYDIKIGILGIVRTRHQPLWVTFVQRLSSARYQMGPWRVVSWRFWPLLGPFWAPFAFEDDPCGVRDLSFCLPPNPHFYVISIDSLSKLRKLRKEETHHSTHPKVRCLTYWFKKNVMIMIFLTAIYQFSIFKDQHQWFCLVCTLLTLKKWYTPWLT